jgi:hypothetical protein
MNLVKGDDGTLLEPEFHDGLFTGIILSEEKGDLTLICKPVDRKEFNLVVPKIDRLRVDYFLEGNTIFEISIHEGASCPASSVECLFNYNEEHARQFLPRHMKEIVDGSWTLLEVSTSYGCQLAALSKAHADEITVSERYPVPLEPPIIAYASRRPVRRRGRGGGA